VSQSSDTGRVVTTRRMRFEDDLSQVPKHFAVDRDVALSHFFALLSAVFPEGEDFFVRSVRHYRDQIVDPDLKRQVAGFIGQESMHGREHRAFNDRLAELGYPVKFVDRMAAKGMRFRERLAPPMANLASTIFIEHVTATLAEIILSDPQARADFGNETVKDVFVWHALEESEHKAVAFDVYRAVGGSERLRIWTGRIMRRAMALSVVALVLSMLFDRSSYRPSTIRSTIRSIRRSPVLSRYMWRTIKEFERPGFHPNDRDTTALVAEWGDRLFGPSGTLNDKLRTAVAA